MLNLRNLIKVIILTALWANRNLWHRGWGMDCVAFSLSSLMKFYDLHFVSPICTYIFLLRFEDEPPVAAINRITLYDPLFHRAPIMHESHWVFRDLPPAVLDVFRVLSPDMFHHVSHAINMECRPANMVQRRNCSFWKISPISSGHKLRKISI